MDEHTLEILEFDRVREAVAGYAACSLGKEAARALDPSGDPAEVRDRQAIGGEMAEALSAGVSPPLGGVHDVRPQVRRAKTGATLLAEELAEVLEVLQAIGRIDVWLANIGDQFPRIGGLRPSVGEFGGVASAIAGCLDSRGAVLDTASRKLSAIRREVHGVEERIQEILRRMLRSPEIRKILRYSNFTMVGHHYVLPIAKEHRGEVQGSVHRTSASNETVFIEPQAIAEQSAQLSFLRAKEQKEVRRILRWLSAQVGQVADSLLTSLGVAAHLDLLQSQGRYSLDFRMAPPDLNTEGRLVLRGARHPILESLFRAESEARRKPPAEPGPDAVEPVDSGPPPPAEPRQVVPIDVRLGVGSNLLIVTGPNTGGKTVAIKTVGLLAAMAQAGLHIPAHQGSQLPIFDDVLADVGDEQSLEQSLSTFSSHVRRISAIVGKATERSLVLLDEMGAGTDPAEGAALGRAILDELDSIGCRALVTTHIGDLKTYAFTNPRAENAAVEFDLESLRPRYRLHIGDVGRSNALEIARRLDLPGHLVDRARRYLDQVRGDQSPEWEVLQKLRKEAEDSRTSALAAEAEAQAARDALHRKLADLQSQTERDSRIDDARARLKPGDRVVIPKLGYDRPGRVVKLDPRKNSATVAIGMMQWDVPVAELIPQVVTVPEAPKAPPPGRSSGRGGFPRLEDFPDA